MIFLTCFFCCNSGIGEVTVVPIGFTAGVEDEPVEVELTLTNDAEEEVAFCIEYEWIQDEEERGLNPRRDDPGDVIRQYRIPYIRTIGLAYDPDNEWMWGLDWTDRRLYSIDIENGEIQVNIVMDQGCVGLFYWEGVLYAGGYNANRLIYRFDQEGRLINTIQLPITLADSHIGGDGQYIFTVAYQRGGGRSDVHVFDMENLEQVAVIDCREGIGVDVWGLEWISDHPRGQLWLCNPSRMFQYHIDEDWNAELVQEFNTVQAQPGHCGLSHDGENMWRGVYGVNDQNWYVIDDGVREFDMLTVEPEEGTVPGNESETVNVIVSPEGYENGVYNVLIAIELSEPEEERDQMEQTLIEITALVSVGDPTYSLSGTVTDAADDEVVANASISLDNYYLTRFTDEEGAYSIDNLPAGEYALTFTAPDYLPAHGEISIEDAEVELDAALLHAECTPSRDEIFMELELDMEHEIEFEVTNGGNGPLTYLVERRLADEEANIDPWELRSHYNIQDIVQDDQLNGAVFTRDNYVISGGNNGEGVNKIYVLNRDGELVEEFDQFNESRYGMRDLAYDGDLIWGADNETLYGFTVEGELESELEIPVDIEGRSIAWDPDQELLWASDISTNIYGINRQGELVETFERPNELRIYGLAYWRDDPDGYNLYVSCRGDTTDIQIIKVNLENGEMMVAAEINMDGSRPGGIQITNRFDVYSWALVGVVQNTDRLAVWQLSTNLSWFRIEPEEGVIEAEESEQFVLTLNSSDLIPDNRFEGELVFKHDGIGGETIIPVILEVFEGGFTSRELDLHIGWNLVSVNLQPDNGENIQEIMAPLVEEGLLVIVKDDEGHFYLPDWDFDEIMWFVSEGYQILVRGDCELTLEGEAVPRDQGIELEQGWQIVSYYPRFPIEATVALSGIEERLVIAKDGYGNFYLPNWEFSNIGEMREGQGYWLKVDADCELVYQIEEDEAAGLLMDNRQLSISNSNCSLPQHPVTCENMSLLVINRAPPFNSPPAERGGSNIAKLPPLLLQERTYIPPLLLQGGSKGGSEIGIYANGQLVGSGVLQDGMCGIAVWGDDPLTDEIDGALEGQQLELKLFKEGELLVTSFEVLQGEAVYSKDGVTVLQLTGSVEVPLEFGIISTYPNPFNSTTRITYSIPEAARIELKLFDLAGREVTTLVNEMKQPGVHTTNLTATDLPSGLYFVRLEVSGKMLSRKVILIR